MDNDKNKIIRQVKPFSIRTNRIRLNTVSPFIEESEDFKNAKLPEPPSHKFTVSYDKYSYHIQGDGRDFLISKPTRLMNGKSPERNLAEKVRELRGSMKSSGKDCYFDIPDKLKEYIYSSLFGGRTGVIREHIVGHHLEYEFFIYDGTHDILEYYEHLNHLPFHLISSKEDKILSIIREIEKPFGFIKWDISKAPSLRNIIHVS